MLLWSNHQMQERVTLAGILEAQHMKRQRSEQAAAPYRSKQRPAASSRARSANGEAIENAAQQQPQQQQKRNKNRGKPEHDEDDKLLHQATLAAAREAKAVKAFLLQKVSTDWCAPLHATVMRASRALA
jgi:hypothetical protein